MAPLTRHRCEPTGRHMLLQVTSAHPYITSSIQARYKWIPAAIQVVLFGEAKERRQRQCLR